MSSIHVENLSKTFKLKKSGNGLKGTIKSFLSPTWDEVHALKGISFDIEKGERVAFIGPNGAGKSTTIKVLSGILHPSSGEVSVNGHVPWVEREDLAYKIGTVFGQRSQLWYHLPAQDTFDLLATAYQIEPEAYKKRLNHLVEAFEIGPLLDKAVRQLSLGQRMRCEIVASFLHTPETLFLDEPTVGLDVSAKAIIRDLVHESSVQDGTTVLLTSHDTGDIEKVCDRVIIIDEGKILIDQSISKLRSDYICEKIVTFQTKEETIDIGLKGVRVIETSPHKCMCSIDIKKQSVEAVIQHAMKQSSLRDITVEDPPMEEILKSIYKE
ncbi:MAG: ABC transporter ATP-binding protein [Bdellovibrionales bacterium]